MFRNAKVQRAAILAVGVLLGCLAVSGRPNLLSQAGATSAAAAVAEADAKQVIVFEVLMPANALLEVDGKSTTETGEVRSFQTPALAVGGRYTYTLKATAGGKTVTRQVYLAHGGTNIFDLRPDFQAAGVAKRAASTLTHEPAAGAAGTITGSVRAAGQPIAGATVTLFAAGEGKPVQLAQGKTGDDGTFRLDVTSDQGKGAADKVLYLVAKGGTGKGPDDAIALMALLGTKLPEKVTVNELTTVASAFTAARFINGESISGKSLGLRIAAGNVPNLVDPVTGGWGKVLLDPLNSTQTTTLANLNTLGSLISAFATVGDDNWRARFLKAATPPGGAAPKTSLEAMTNIARQPWVNAKELYALFDEAYPQPKDGSWRKAPFVPYLALSPPDFVLSLCFAGGGMCANGRFMFDADGNLWSGQNWMAGSQSGVLKNIGGALIKVAPDGTPLSPPILGFRGMGLDGVGWGTAVTRDRVWASGFNGKILVTDFQGRPVAKESDFPFKEKLSNLMGVGVSAKGDVWIADGADNQLLHFPGGSIKDGRIVKVKGLKSPFDIVIDSQDRVWVSNSQSDTLLRFPAANPDKVETFHAGISVRALALDSKENLWVSSNLSLDFPAPKVPDGATIMEQFKLLGEAVLNYPKSTGVIHMIRPDGTQLEPKGFTGGGAVDIPWGVNIDGNDDVWIGLAAFHPSRHGVVLLAGANPQGHPPGTKPGDLIHRFQIGSIQILTDVAIDPAGNLWAANNFNNLDAVFSPNPAIATSTQGGGSGLTIIYGVAGPVQPPRMGKVRQP